jgi:hypothetical protein
MHLDTGKFIVTSCQLGSLQTNPCTFINYLIFSLLFSLPSLFQKDSVFLNTIFSERDRSVGIATGYWLDDQVSILGRVKTFSLFHNVQTGSGSYPMGTGGDLQGGKGPGREADDSPLSSFQVKSIPPHLLTPVTVDERSKACTVFARLEAGTVGSNSTQDMNV